MIIINNVPCKYVEEFPMEMEFILLHKLLDNKIYRDYYIKNKSSGKYKILDSSGYELKEGLDNELLLKYAKMINATEIIIQDFYGDKDKTLKSMYSFLEKYPDCKYRLQTVPQGKNQSELIECFIIMNRESKINTLGINKLWNRKNFNLHTNKELHLLGTNKLSDWSLSNIQYFRSADSRVLTKLVTGKDDIWNENLNKIQIIILKNLINEVEKWE